MTGTSADPGLVEVGITLANLSILETGTAKAIRFRTIDALCRMLDCRPGDLLTHRPGPAH